MNTEEMDLHGLFLKVGFAIHTQLRKCMSLGFMDPKHIVTAPVRQTNVSETVNLIRFDDMTSVVI